MKLLARDRHARFGFGCMLVVLDDWQGTRSGCQRAILTEGDGCEANSLASSRDLYLVTISVTDFFSIFTVRKET